ncbi:MAG: shikimate kinase [Bacteroidales bacterium]|jgi:shikimate kinase|nr:shikimate kinase [Bacteroidales bacterium]
MRIYLTGYMGSGKSTLARKIAAQLGLAYIDMDRYIENRFNRTVSAIFREEGELAFRRKERDCLLEISAIEDIIVATGGGAPCYFDNAEVMNASGFCVFLDVSARELALRLTRSRTIRPLVQQKRGVELLSYIEDTLEKRRPFYGKAQYHITSDEITPEIIIEKLGLDGSVR